MQLCFCQLRNFLLNFGQFIDQGELVTEREEVIGLFRQRISAGEEGGQFAGLLLQQFGFGVGQAADMLQHLALSFLKLLAVFGKGEAHCLHGFPLAGGGLQMGVGGIGGQLFRRVVFEVVVRVADAVADLLDVEEGAVGDAHGRVEGGENGLQLVALVGLGVFHQRGLVAVGAAVALLFAQNAEGHVSLGAVGVGANEISVVLAVDLAPARVAQSIGGHHEGEGGQVQRGGLDVGLEGVEGVDGLPAGVAVVDATVRAVVLSRGRRTLGALGVSFPRRDAVLQLLGQQVDQHVARVEDAGVPGCGCHLDFCLAQRAFRRRF